MNKTLMGMRIFFVVAFFVLAFSLHAQNTGSVSRYYGEAACYEEGAGIIATPGGYLLSAAYNCQGGAQNWSGYLLQLDANGDTLTTSRDNIYNGKLFQTVDGNRVFAGGNVAGNAYDTIRITKVAVSGTVIWSTPLHFGACKTTVGDITEVADGLLVTGYYGTGNCAAPNFDAFIAKLDFGGAMQWSIEVDGHGDEQLHAIKQLPDGRIAAFGWTSTDVRNNGIDYMLVFLSTDGKLEQRKIFGNEYNNFGYGLEVSYTGGLITNGYAFNMEVYELDAQGDVLSHREFGASCGSTYFKVKRTGDGGYAYLGTEDVSGQCTAVFIKTDADGKVQYTKNWAARLRDFTENANGQFALTGYANYLPDAIVILFDSTRLNTNPAPFNNPYTPAEPEVRNIKDQDVQSVLDSMNISTTVDENRVNDLAQIKLYPNPANNYINIEFSNPDRKPHTLEIYTVAGQLVDYFENITGNRFKIDLSEMPNGAYTYKLSNNTGFFTGKFMVNGK